MIRPSQDEVGQGPYTDNLTRSMLSYVAQRSAHAGPEDGARERSVTEEA